MTVEMPEQNVSMPEPNIEQGIWSCTTDHVTFPGCGTCLACRAALARGWQEPDRDAIRKAITDAYYETRNEGGTMEQAADRATDAVLGLR